MHANKICNDIQHKSNTEKHDIYVADIYIKGHEIEGKHHDNSLTNGTSHRSAACSQLPAGSLKSLDGEGTNPL